MVSPTAAAAATNRGRELEALREIAEARLVAMGHVVVEIDEAAVRVAFLRTSAIANALRYEVQLAGTQCAFTVWSTGVEGDGATAVDQALDAEVTALRRDRRLVVHIINVFDDVLVLRGELLAAPGVVLPRPDLDAEMRSMLKQFWEPRVIARQVVDRITGIAAITHDHPARSER